MKQIVKGYHVFLPYTWERVVLYLIYPVLVVLTCFWGELLFRDAWVMICSSLITMMELYFDLLVFGGIASKETNKLDYIKTSFKGMAVLRNSLLGDGLRRIISTTSVFIVTGLFLDTTEYSCGEFVMFIVVTLLIVEMGLVLVRTISLTGVVISTNMLFSVCSLLVMVSVLSGSVLVWILYGLLYLVFLLGSRILIMWKARKSYYDERA